MSFSVYTIWYIIFTQKISLCSNRSLDFTYCNEIPLDFNLAYSMSKYPWIGFKVNWCWMLVSEWVWQPLGYMLIQINPEWSPYAFHIAEENCNLGPHHIVDKISFLAGGLNEDYMKMEKVHISSNTKGALTRHGSVKNLRSCCFAALGVGRDVLILFSESNR